MKPVVDEIEIESTHGKVVAKTWNEETPDSKRVLAIHGWMDNAGSFDNMLKELVSKQDLYVVAIDLPGHGKSSQLACGCFYTDQLMIAEIRRFLLDIGWIRSTEDPVSDDNQETLLRSSSSYDNVEALADNHNDRERKFTIIGHSYGGFLAMCYASMFPKGIETVILLDFIKAKSLSYENMLTESSETMNNLIKKTPRKTVETGSHEYRIDCGQMVVKQESAIIATMEAHKSLGEISRDETMCLLKRSTIPVTVPANSVIYYRDMRLNYLINMRNNIEINKALFTGIRSNVFIILSKKGLYSREDEFKDDLETMVEYIKSKAKSFDIDWIDGDHFFHMNRAKEAAELVGKYLRFEEKEIV